MRSLFVVLFFSLISVGVTAKEIDRNMTTSTWTVGEVVATFTQNLGSHITYERIFLGKTQEGYYRVQDMYINSGKKYSNPYILKTREAVLTEQWVSGWFEDFIGDYVIWYPNGQKSVEGGLLDGENHGFWEHWYDNGQKEQEGLFHQGEQQGTWNHWYRDGAKESEWIFGADGIAHFTYWYESGAKKEEGVFQENSYIILKSWDEQGQLIEGLNELIKLNK